mgnify:CR=1 FL=1
MEIEKLGVEGLHKHIVSALELPKFPNTVSALTDDAALIETEKGEELVIGSKLFLEGIHFDLVYFPLQYLGFKVVTAAVSEVVAMGAMPRHISLSIGLSRKYQVEDVDVLMLGVKDALAYYGIDLIELNATTSYTGLTLSVTAIGAVAKGQALQSKGARLHDLLCLTGDVGAAYMGLQLLIREKVAFNGEEDFQPKFEGREYILSRQMKPSARIDILKQLKENGIIPTAMTGVINGVSNALLHLCDRSQVGAKLYEQRLPIDHETVSMADELGLSPTMIGLHGGDDYELLFTIPLGLKDMIETIEGVHTIGYITDTDEGIRLVSSGGSETSIVPQHYEQ